ncbi:WD40-repeat-containing domain protein [Radiomyces spectabilis]|uniref:WD40-repeat-containing domain protein n=1 Tax=Radiomyces spectabilis TaxID=64574 RepID=UPI00221FE7E6|nr:WD40-repeat-containing domain protein [Radiomyces spectabilis]KAI8384389.1 WD40-repeat-containing domain protein [Radiomyces spectabilis]
MIIYKPSWITHGDHALGSKGKKPCIYSIHVHPDGSRLATGGLDATVKIWNTQPVLDERAEMDTNCHKLLCTMTMHNGAVLCVRWSNDGRYLASSSDNDNVIIIWELDKEAGSGSVFGSSEVNRETWRPVKYLRGHDSDVQDLAWSKDNQYLASCGVDGYVIVWDAQTFEQVKKIDQHGGFVKGVTWDPVGKYLASQSDDKMVKIWRTSDWELEKDIKGPFINAPGTTLYRRLSWSPNGSHIAAANAVNGIQCVAAVISRDDWAADISFVGHQLPIEVTCFNPKLFRTSSGKSDTDNASDDDTWASICALGGQDRSISIWLTKYCRPLCVAADVFDNNVYDLAWTPDGKNLFACSQDGTVACLQLGEELREVAPEEEMLKQLSRYGYGRRNAQLPETPGQLTLEDEHAISSKALSSKRIADLMGVNTTPSSSQSPTPMDVDAKPTSSPVNETGNTPTVASSSLSVSQPRPADADFTSSSGSAPVTPLQQKVTIGKDGKRRIQPIMIRSGTSSSSNQSSAQSRSYQSMQASQGTGANPSNQTNSMATTSAVSSLERVDYDDPAVSLPTTGLKATVVGNKRKAEATESDGTVSAEVSGTAPANPRERPEWIDAAVIPPVVLLPSQVKLGAPKVKSTFIRKTSPTESNTVMECHNPRDKDYAKLVVSRHGSILWTDYLPSAILLMTGNSLFCAAGCEDGTLHVYSPAGRRLMPPVILESTPVILQCNEQWLLCLTLTGLIYTWDIPREQSCLDGISVAPLLRVAQLPSNGPQKAPTIKDARVQKNGSVLLVTSYRQAFTYHGGMKAWVRVSDAWYIISEFWGSESRPGHDRLQHPLGWLSLAVMRGPGRDPTSKSLSSLSNSDKDIIGTITISHIEIQLAVAALLESPEEYREWLIFYARRLSKENAQGKVEELCRWLAGPPFIHADSDSPWESTILDRLSKHELLKQLLPILGQNRQLQRILNDYSTFIGG